MRTSMGLARVAEVEGRLAETAQHLRDYMAEAESRSLATEYLAGATELSLLEVRYRNRPSEALAIVQSALARHPLDSLAPRDRPYLRLARVYVESGKLDLARRALRDYEAAGSPPPQGPRDPLLARGLVAEREGRTADAVAAYRDVYDHSGPCGTCGLFELASLYDRQGQADSARILHQRIVDQPTAFGHLGADHYALAPTYKRLGELYEAKGDRRKAAEYYGRFVELWKNADPELQPGVKEVRGRIARLAQEPGT
jgi:tetratricopeptide (TPR) repeat protein